jgi:hypothetical protein
MNMSDDNSASGSLGPTHSELLENIIDSIISIADETSKKSTKPPQEYYRIRGSGSDLWLYHPQHRTCLPVARGSEVLVLNRMDERGRVLAATQNDYFWIDPKELVKIGYN